MWEEDVFLPLSRSAAENLRTGYGSRVPLSVTYMAQRSIQDELSVEDAQNAFVVVVSYVAMFFYMNLCFTVIFVLEAAIKILGLGPRWYFVDAWNTFDFTVVVFSILTLI